MASPGFKTLLPNGPWCVPAASLLGSPALRGPVPGPAGHATARVCHAGYQWRLSTICGSRGLDALGADRGGVLAADAVAEAGDVGAVDVHGDGHAVTGVADPVDVAGRGEAAGRPGRVHVAGDDPELAAVVGK